VTRRSQAVPVTLPPLPAPG